MSDIVPIHRALISVSDKTGMVELAEDLIGRGVEIISTGGSAKALRDAGLAVTEVSDHTGFPEILDGRVKTLVPQIHGGILARRDEPTHLAQMAAHDIAPIDLVVVNLYPFEATVARGADFATCVETIDIGGPALIRAAAKNHEFVTVLTSPADYAGFLDNFTEFDGRTSLDFRQSMALRAFARTSAYDGAIARWFERETVSDFERKFTPDMFMITGNLEKSLRYGENPHQNAQFYSTGAAFGVATAQQIQGKALSYNNLNDTDAAFECVAEFDDPAVVIVKHANPCGVASAATLSAAWDAALACDPVSAFGGIVALNRPLDEATAAKIATIFTEVIIAPDATEGARQLLASKKNLRLLLAGGMPDPAQPGQMFKSIAGGFLVQAKDSGRPRVDEWKIVTKSNPTPAQMRDMIFAFQVAKHVKSNAIVYARNLATLGIGAGQMNRVDSARIAGWKAEAAGLDTAGCVVASDAFFPFADGLQAAIAAGAAAVVQPGGSIRDAEVIAAADAAGITMLFTGRRHFRH